MKTVSSNTEAQSGGTPNNFRMSLDNMEPIVVGAAVNAANTGWY